MIDISVPQAEAYDLAYAVYLPFHTSDRNPGRPLTKTEPKKLDVNSLDSWLDDQRAEDIGDRHHCGFFTYLTMSAFVCPEAHSEQFFDVKYRHGSRLFTWPDQGVVKAGFEKGHLSFARRAGRSVFYLTPLGVEEYQRWYETRLQQHLSNISAGNFPNLLP